VVLANALRAHEHRPLRIGTFSAASNVTGALSDTDAIASLLHGFGALSFWDYASAGPYLLIRVGASAPGRGDHKDAVFLSPHKFLGGPQTPGVLVARRELFTNRVPTVPGGGVVAFVNQVGQWYLGDPETREEGGTPAIVESIRAGLVFGLKDAIGTDLIGRIDTRYYRRALDRWLDNPNLEILGNPHTPRLPIVSFRVRHGARILHHHYVVALLNDLFGIQARGGCSCAGPYGHRLLGIAPERSHAIQEQVDRGYFGTKPGWARVNLHYGMSESTVDFIIEAVDLIGSYGYRLLADYRFDPHTGHWRHRRSPVTPVRRLDDLLPGVLRGSPAPAPVQAQPLPPQVVERSLAEAYLGQARTVLAAGAPGSEVDGPTDLPPEFEALREFYLPAACLPASVLN